MAGCMLLILGSEGYNGAEKLLDIIAQRVLMFDTLLPRRNSLFSMKEQLDTGHAHVTNNMRDHKLLACLHLGLTHMRNLRCRVLRCSAAIFGGVGRRGVVFVRSTEYNLQLFGWRSR